MKPIAIINSDYDDYLHVTFAFTNVCNYDCHYCTPLSKSGSYRFPDYDLVIKNMDHMLNIYRTHFNKKVIRMHVVGGEPTLWPKLGDFVKWSHDNYQCRVTMSTNGSRTLRWWDEYAHYFDDIQISVHHEFTDIDHIKKVLDLIYSKQDIMVAAQVLMDPLHWDKCLGILNDLVDYPTPWLVKSRVVLDLDEKNIRPEYTEEQLEFLKEKVKKIPPSDYVARMKSTGKIQNSEKANAVLVFQDGSQKQYNTFEVWKNQWHKFYGWECNLGVDRVAIGASGIMIGSCLARNMFNQDTPFSIYDPDFSKKFNKDLIKPITCKEIFCSGCSSDIRLPKRKQNV